jgi:adenosylcobyric acid synthase
MAPWLASARSLPAEDAVVLERPVRAGGDKRLRIVVPMLSRIANFDEFDPLRADPDIDFAFLPPGTPVPGDADLVILPGTKATLADLAFLRVQGWDIDILAHVRRGRRVLGVCGGYQMLGRTVSDPHGIEGAPGSAAGLGLLDVETVLLGDKVLRAVSGRLLDGDAAFSGYEMHIGRTTGPGAATPLLAFEGGAVDGAVSADGRVAGAYVHGLFERGEARAALLAPLGLATTPRDHAATVDAALDEIAAMLARSLDIDAVARIAGL